MIKDRCVCDLHCSGATLWSWCPPHWPPACGQSGPYERVSPWRQILWWARWCGVGGTRSPPQRSGSEQTPSSWSQVQGLKGMCVWMKSHRDIGRCSHHRRGLPILTRLSCLYIQGFTKSSNSSRRYRCYLQDREILLQSLGQAVVKRTTVGT